MGKVISVLCNKQSIPDGMGLLVWYFFVREEVGL